MEWDLCARFGNSVRVARWKLIGIWSGRRELCCLQRHPCAWESNDRRRGIRMLFACQQRLWRWRADRNRITRRVYYRPAQHPRRRGVVRLGPHSGRRERHPQPRMPMDVLSMTTADSTDESNTRRRCLPPEGSAPRATFHSNVLPILMIK